MVRGLFGDIVAPCIVWIFPVTGIDFAENGVEWFLYAAMLMSELISEQPGKRIHTVA